MPAGLFDDPVAIGMLSGDGNAALLDQVAVVVAEGWWLGRRPITALLVAGWTFDDIGELVPGAAGRKPFDFDGGQVDREALIEMGTQLALARLLVPLHANGSRKKVAVVDPNDLATKDAIVGRFGTSNVEVVVVDRESIEAAIRAVERSAAAAEVSAAANRAAQKSDEDSIDTTLAEVVVEGPHLQLINSLFEQAVASRASDIHFTPTGNQLQISMRVDGVLSDIGRHPRRLAQQVVQALKQLAHVNLVEQRLPQDGVIPHRLPNGRELEMRASFIPGQYGLEKVTLRIVDKTQGVIRTEALGLSPAVSTALSTILRSNYGILLVAGPTGSGKTTTLYAVLDGMNDGKNNILTVEDPVEITMPGIHQVAVNAAIGLTFGSVLSRFLRADPDIMLVGEIRDAETAETAIQAAQTGHLVLSTIHTNTAAGAAPRLIQMGVEGYAISSGLVGVINQRLIRKLCTACRLRDDAPYDQVDWGDRGRPETLFSPKKNGCSRCNNLGFTGRTPVAEALVVNDAIRDAIVAQSSESTIARIAIEQGMVPMSADALEKVRSGVTSMSEYLTFTGAI
ncbi:MAG: GspE/PulE family protein [Actinomycetota bacterium]|nr:GspE/PulE family protein [Actinomycetota bacterium]